MLSVRIYYMRWRFYDRFEVILGAATATAPSSVMCTTLHKQVLKKRCMSKHTCAHKYVERNRHKCTSLMCIHVSSYMHPIPPTTIFKHHLVFSFDLDTKNADLSFFVLALANHPWREHSLHLRDFPIELCIAGLYLGVRVLEHFDH